MILEDDRDDEARREVEARGFDVEETLSRPMSEWD